MRTSWKLKIRKAKAQQACDHRYVNVNAKGSVTQERCAKCDKARRHNA